MIVLTLGTFDLFHYGHVRLLLRCRGLAGPTGKVIVALNPDEFVEQFKGRRPVLSYGERREVLEACRYVDKVVPNTDGADSKPVISRVRPDLIVIGDDWKHRDYYAQLAVTEEWLERHGVRVVYVPYTQTISSSQIRTTVWPG